MIKVCGLTDRQNIEALLSCTPDFIGLIFYPGSPRCITGKNLLPGSWLRSIPGVARTGVFVNQPQAYIRECIAAYGLDYIQLHGSESPEYCKVVQACCPVIKAFAVYPGFDTDRLHDYAAYCAYFLFDTPAAGHGGAGKSFDWSLLPAAVHRPFLLAGGIGPGDASRLKALSLPCLAGVDVNSRFETAPGLKNITHLKSFIHELRN